LELVNVRGPAGGWALGAFGGGLPRGDSIPVDVLLDVLWPKPDHPAWAHSVVSNCPAQSESSNRSRAAPDTSGGILDVDGVEYVVCDVHTGQNSTGRDGRGGLPATV